MIVISHGNGFIYNAEFVENETVDQFLVRLKDQLSAHFNGNFSLRETQTGRPLAGLEVMMDDRRYYLDAWLRKADTV